MADQDDDVLSRYYPPRQSLLSSILSRYSGSAISDAQRDLASRSMFGAPTQSPGMSELMSLAPHAPVGELNPAPSYASNPYQPSFAEAASGPLGFLAGFMGWPRVPSLMRRLEGLPQAPTRDVLSSGLPLERRDMGSGRQEWLVTPPGGRDYGVVGAIADPATKTMKISGSALDGPMQGQGTGVAMYQRLIDEAHRLGYTVHSDTSVSGAAQRIYEGLRARGYDVQTNPNAVRPYPEGRDFLQDGRPNNIHVPGRNDPVFTVGPIPPLDALDQRLVPVKER